MCFFLCNLEVASSIPGQYMPVTLLSHPDLIKETAHLSYIDRKCDKKLLIFFLIVHSVVH